MLEPQVVTAVQNARQPALLSKLREMTGPLLHMDPAKIDVDARFLEMGADSLVLIEAVRAIEETFGVTLKIQQLFEDVTSLADLAAYLDRVLPPEVLALESSSVPLDPVTSIRAVTPALSAPLTMPGSGPFTAALPATALEQLFAQQLRIISQQLELLKNSDGSRPPESAPRVNSSLLGNVSQQLGSLTPGDDDSPQTVNEDLVEIVL